MYLADAKRLINAWYMITMDINRNITTLTINIMKGGSPIIRGLAVHKYVIKDNITDPP